VSKRKRRDAFTPRLPELLKDERKPELSQASFLGVLDALLSSVPRGHFHHDS
jgi:hypothetical protein